MKLLVLEKLVSMATFEELWKLRRPDFRALTEIRTLKRHDITARYERFDNKTYRVVTEVNEKTKIDYLVLKRGFVLAKVKREKKPYTDVIRTILKRPRNGAGGGIPLTRGEVAMLFFDGYAGDRPGLLDIRSQGYGDDNDWNGLIREDIFSCDEGEDAAFVWSKWEPLELWTS